MMTAVRFESLENRRHWLTGLLEMDDPGDRISVGSRVSLRQRRPSPSQWRAENVEAGTLALHHHPMSLDL